jgi:glycosyltransferase involved in cell wall biosynthesis
MRDTLQNQPSVFYMCVQDPGYPRNLRVRTYLSQLFETEIQMALLDGELSRSRRWIGFVRALLRHGRKKDIYILAEFSNKFVLLAWLWARSQGGRLVVDGFIGMYETRIGDWKERSRLQLRTRFYKTIDFLGRNLADIYLIDTQVRARAVESLGSRADVLALPVGAPSWAVARPSPSSSSTIRLLYYGNYAPLHGLPTLLGALKLASEHGDFQLTLVGNGRLRPLIEEEAARRGVNERCTFSDSVPEERLASVIADHDVVLGIFGDSEKAGSVIANKVWQGLSCGKMVITQSSPALAEIAGIVADQLITVPAADERRLAQALTGVDTARTGDWAHSAERLSNYVSSQYAQLGTALMLHVSR